MDTIEILKNYSDYLQVSGIVSDVFRTLGWWIIKGMAWLIEQISEVAQKAFVLNTVIDNDAVKSYLEQYSAAPLIAALFTVSILFIGYKVIFNKKTELSSVVINGLLAMAIIMVLPMFMSKMSDLTQKGVGFATDTTTTTFDSKFTDTVLRGNIYDMLVVDKADFPSDPASIETKINVEPLKIDINEKVKASNKLNNKEVFQKKIVTDSDGAEELKKLEGGFNKEQYYRFHVSFFYTIIQLLVVGGSLILTMIKLARMQFELAFHQLFATVVAPLDLDSGQKMKQILKEIVSIFFVTILIAGLLQFYTIFAGICSDIGGFFGIIMLLASSFALIDGPNLVEKILGIDAGIRSGTRMIASTFMASKTITGAGKAIGGAGKAAGTAAARGVGYGAMAGGAAAGVASGMKSGFQSPPNNDGNSGGHNPVNPTAPDNDGNKQSSLYGDGGMNSDGYDETMRGSNVRMDNPNVTVNKTDNLDNDSSGVTNNGSSLYKDMEFENKDNSDGYKDDKQNIGMYGGMPEEKSNISNVSVDSIKDYKNWDDVNSTKSDVSTDSMKEYKNWDDVSTAKVDSTDLTKEHWNEVSTATPNLSDDSIISSSDKGRPISSESPSLVSDLESSGVSSVGDGNSKSGVEKAVSEPGMATTGTTSSGVSSASSPVGTSDSSASASDESLPDFNNKASSDDSNVSAAAATYTLDNMMNSTETTPMSEMKDESVVADQTLDINNQNTFEKESSVNHAPERNHMTHEAKQGEREEEPIKGLGDLMMRKTRKTSAFNKASNLRNEVNTFNDAGKKTGERIAKKIRKK